MFPVAVAAVVLDVVLDGLDVSADVAAALDAFDVVPDDVVRRDTGRHYNEPRAPWERSTGEVRMDPESLQIKPTLIGDSIFLFVAFICSPIRPSIHSFIGGHRSGTYTRR